MSKSKFKKTKQIGEQEAEKLAKTIINNMEGSGVFSTIYYYNLVGKKKFELLRQGNKI